MLISVRISWAKNYVSPHPLSSKLYCEVINDHTVGLWIQTSHKIHTTINRQNRKAAVFGIRQPFASLCQVCFGHTYGDGWGRAALCGSQWFKSLSSPKTISTIFPCFKSAGITLTASHMSTGECGSHQGQALSLHTLDTHSARVNKPQPSPSFAPFSKRRGSPGIE